MEVEIVAGDGCGKIWEGCLFGTDVVGADFLADVAAKYPVADFGTQFFWDDALVFDCEVGDAFPRIQNVGFGKRICGTNL